MHAAVGPVAEIAGRDRAEFVAQRPFEDKDEFVAVVAVHGQGSPGLNPGHDRPTLARLVAPQLLGSNPRLQLLPFQLADLNHA